MTKHLTTATIVISSILITSVIAAGLVIREMNPSASFNQSQNASAVTANLVKLTPEEIARHKTESDCWMIIEGNVYNLSSFSSGHPGGKQAIVNFCGKDGTTAFKTKGGNSSHSQTAVQMLTKFLIGPLGEDIRIQNIASNPPASPKYDDDDADSEIED